MFDDLLIVICSLPASAVTVNAPLAIVCPVASIPPLKVESLVTLSSSAVTKPEDVIAPLLIVPILVRLRDESITSVVPTL